MEEINQESNNNLQIFARCRGLRSIEISQGCNEQIEIYNIDQSLQLGPTKYLLNKVFSNELTQKQFYESSLKLLLKETITKNQNFQCFCYGYSATGKRYTMEGEEKQEQQGIIPQFINDLFEWTEKEKSKMISFTCIYDDEIIDLLSAKKKKLQAQEINTKEYFEIKGAEKIEAKSAEEMMNLFWKGVKSKKNEHTTMSKNVFYMATIVELYYGESKFQFINPGSIESLLDCGHSKVLLQFFKIYDKKEIQKLVASIQKQLLSLKNVLEDLRQKKQFIRWRGSNLTKLLKFGFAQKNCKQVMIVNLANCDKEFNSNKKCLDLAQELFQQVRKIESQAEEVEEQNIIIEEEN